MEQELYTSIKEAVFWFMFFMGFMAFVGLLFSLWKFITSIPDSFELLGKQLKVISTVLNSSDAVEHFQNVKTYDDHLTSAILLIEVIEKQVDNLKYQHDHPDNFFFGTEKTNQLLQEVSNRLVLIEAGIEILKQRKI